MKNWIIRKVERLRTVVNFSVSNPVNFEEMISFQSTWLRVLSLSLLIIIIFCSLTFYLFVLGPFSDLYSSNDKTIERSTLETQAKQMNDLQKEIKAHQDYSERLRKIIAGDIPVDIELDTNMGSPDIDYDKIDDRLSDLEISLMDEVKQDMRTISDQEKTILVSFYSPLQGIISQKFSSNHRGVDIVVKEGTDVHACQSGNVIYAAFTQSDGYVLVVHHDQGYLSVYKHNKFILKKSGDRVGSGDLIAKAGTTGENSTGPHLHFELWHNGKAIDPLQFIRFTH